jgi:DNA-binding MarR family transcriptional regulator
MRRTVRTRAVLDAIEKHPGAANVLIAPAAGVKDAGQLSKLLRRLEREGLIRSQRQQHLQGRPLAWWLTEKGRLATWKTPAAQREKP